MKTNKTRIIEKLTKDFGPVWDNITEVVQDCYDEIIDSTKFVTLDAINIPADQCGMLAPMIETCSVIVKCGICPKGEVWFIYEYKYSHTNGGSNGYDVRFGLGR